jgi:hypothetical protein
LSWWRHPYNNEVIAITVIDVQAPWCLQAVVAMVLPSSMPRCLCSPDNFVIVAITMLPLLQWGCCHYQAGVVALLMMALLPLLTRT